MIISIIVLTIPIGPKAIRTVFFKSVRTSFTMNIKHFMYSFIDDWEIEREAVFHGSLIL